MRSVAIMTVLTFVVLGSAPTASAEEVRIGHLEDDVAADRLLQPGPFVLAPRRQADVEQRDIGDRGFGHSENPVCVGWVERSETHHGPLSAARR